MQKKLTLQARSTLTYIRSKKDFLTSSAETNINPEELHWRKLMGDRCVDDCSNTSEEFTSQMEISPFCQPTAASFFSGCHCRHSTSMDLWMTRSAISSPCNHVTVQYLSTAGNKQSETSIIPKFSLLRHLAIITKH